MSFQTFGTTLPLHFSLCKHCVMHFKGYTVNFYNQDYSSSPSAQQLNHCLIFQHPLILFASTSSRSTFQLPVSILVTPFTILSFTVHSFVWQNASQGKNNCKGFKSSNSPTCWFPPYSISRKGLKNHGDFFLIWFIWSLLLVGRSSNWRERWNWLWESQLPHYIFPQIHRAPEFVRKCHESYDPNQRAIMSPIREILYPINADSIEKMLQAPATTPTHPFSHETLIEAYNKLDFTKRS